MTKLEELKATYVAASAAAADAHGAADDAWDAYKEELEKTEEENPND
jgi:hypothetical protein